MKKAVITKDIALKLNVFLDDVMVINCQNYNCAMKPFLFLRHISIRHLNHSYNDHLKMFICQQ